METINIIRKHVKSSITHYADLQPALGSRTLASITSLLCSDSTMTATSGTVLSADTTVTRVERDEAGNTTTTTYVIAANKGISMLLAGGTTNSGCVKVRVIYVDSSGETDAVDCLVSVHGVST